MLVPRLAEREGHMVEEKRRIARAALAEVPERGTLIIDSGSTALHLADLLQRDRDLVVVTNSIPIMRSLATTERPKVIGLGGKLERRTMAFVDEAGVEMLLVGLSVGTNYGPDYKQEFEGMYADLAEKYDVPLYPDFAAGLRAGSGMQDGMLEFMQADGIHPNAEGVSVIVAAMGPTVLDLVQAAVLRLP